MQILLTLRDVLLSIRSIATPAYIDPTSGGTLLQLLLGGSVTFVLLRQAFKAKLLSLFRRKPKSEHEDSDV